MVVDALRIQMVRVKTEGVKENVECVVTLLSSLNKAREELHAKWGAKLESTGRNVEAAENKMTDRVEALGEKILGVLDKSRRNWWNRIIH